MKSYPPKPSFYQKHLPWLNWGIATFFCLFQFFLQTSATVMAKQWMKDFHLNNIGLSYLSAAFYYSYVIMQIPVGFMNDRFNPRRILVLGAFFIAAGCFLLGFTKSVIVAFVARILMGTGSSFGFISMLYICSRWFSPDKFAFMVGISEAAGMIGVGITTLLVAWFISFSSWRYSIIGSGVIAVFVLIAAHLVVRDKPIETSDEPQKVGFLKSMIIALKQKQILLASLFGFLAFAIVNAIASLWGVPFIHHVYHFSVSLSTAIISMLLYGIAAGTPLSGWISFKINQRKPIMLVGSSFTTLFLSILIFVPHLPIWALFTLFFLTGFFGSSYIQCFGISKESTPPAIHGVSLAITNMAIMIGAPFFQIFIGYLLGNGFFHLSQTPALTYRLSMGIIPLGIAISFFVALMIKETYTKGTEN